MSSTSSDSTRSHHAENNPEGAPTTKPDSGDDQKGKRPIGTLGHRPREKGERIADRYEIVEQLGRGGFGAVYKAHDRFLKRSVAVKCANGLRSFVGGQIRSEAQAIASLSHPNIIAIYDLIALDDDELLIVMECPDGMTLSKHALKSPMPVVETMEIVRQIADALQHAHSRQIVHSDLKPTNLLMCSDGRVRLLDFGLAVACFPDPERGKPSGGTPGYMSPEQIRGESHLIDGRADIWALGVILYQLLTGTRPFVGETDGQVFKSSLQKDPPPIRQLRPEVDNELQRIVSRCLRKRMSDRYSSAGELIEDLDGWLANAPPESKTAMHMVATESAALSSSSSKLKTKGLQPFTEQDAETYLSLIPGSRDRNGLPDSIRFWQSWAESDDAEMNSPVGVLYGPSGSGKTSFVRAGLVQSLSSSVCCVYVECRTGDLAGRVTRIIQSRIHEEPSGSSLRDLLTRIRTGDSTRRGFRKLLIVLDQFEAWSHHASLQERQDFADALRQCDGTQIRALVVTRDDFWMGVTELLGWLELPLQEGRNMASIDLLGTPDAEHVLELIGRSNDMLPVEPTALSTGQRQFIRQAVEELAVGESVIAIHLVMFAQMAKVRQWTPRSLRQAGGVTGACSMFFQDVFGSAGRSRSPQYRRIAPAVVPILSALLPPDGSSVTDRVLTLAELMEEAERTKSGHLVRDCVEVLSDDLRILTVTDVNTSVPEDDSLDVSPGLQQPRTDYTYHLSHDFLVEPTRAWIDRVRKRTWRGRKQARLIEISHAWQLRPSHFYMPGFFEYCSLALASRFGGSGEREQEFMRVATRHHSGRISVAILAMIAFVVMTGVAIYHFGEAKAAQARTIDAQVDLLLNGKAEDVSRIIQKLNEHPRSARREVTPWADSIDPQFKLRAQLFLHSQQAGSFTEFAPLIAEAPDELFTAVLGFAESSSDAMRILGQIASDRESERQGNRAAILLHYLGDTGPIEQLLQGSDDFGRDGELLLEASRWRSVPDPWVRLLADSSHAVVRYHAAVILSSFPRSELAAIEQQIDTRTMINASQAAVHSAGRLLAAHLGRDPYEVELSPPADANWKVGPDGIPMVRIEPGELSYIAEPNSPDKLTEISIDQAFWVATVPVSRRLYNEFANESPLLPSGSKTAVPGFGLGVPNELRADPSQPVFGINHISAVAFCNWLSKREGLDACYVYENPESASPIKPEDEQNASSSQPYVPPNSPWKLVATAKGFRLPTPQMYFYLARCGYRQGIPWGNAEAMSRNGGDFEEAPANQYSRSLFSLLPNRLGLFVNDMQCGAWAFADDRKQSAARVGPKRAFRRLVSGRTSSDYSILLIQTD